MIKLRGLEYLLEWVLLYLLTSHQAVSLLFRLPA